MLYLLGAQLQIPIAADSWEILEPDEIGGFGRALSGAGRSNRRALKSGIGFSTPPLTLEDFTIWRTLFSDKSSVWTFDGVDPLYSSKGQRIVADGGAISVATGGAIGSAKSLAINADGEIVRVFDVELSDVYSFSFWYVAPADPARWLHFVGDSIGTHWIDGVEAGSFPPWVFIDGGQISIQRSDINQGPIKLDELTVFPGADLPSSMIEKIYTAGATFSTGFRLLPYLRIIEAGSVSPVPMFGAREVTVHAQFDGAEIVPAFEGGQASRRYVIRASLWEK